MSARNVVDETFAAMPAASSFLSIASTLARGLILSIERARPSRIGPIARVAEVLPLDGLPRLNWPYVVARRTIERRCWEG